MAALSAGLTHHEAMRAIFERFFRRSPEHGYSWAEFEADALTILDAGSTSRDDEVAGLRSAAAEAIRFLNVVGDPIAAYLTLVAALEGDHPKPKVAPVVPDPATPCTRVTCGHRRDHHINRDVDDVVGWPCRDCRSKRCRGFEAPA